jgi:hypothetical protein
MDSLRPISRAPLATERQAKSAPEARTQLGVRASRAWVTKLLRAIRSNLPILTVCGWLVAAALSPIGEVAQAQQLSPPENSTPNLLRDAANGFRLLTSCRMETSTGPPGVNSKNGARKIEC